VKKLAGLLVGNFLIFAMSCFTPTNAIVRSEFLERHPESEIVNTELIFEQDGRVVYIVSSRLKGNANVLKYDFALK
jgi:hypothetical protein